MHRLLHVTRPFALVCVDSNNPRNGKDAICEKYGLQLTLLATSTDDQDVIAQLQEQDELLVESGCVWPITSNLEDSEYIQSMSCARLDLVAKLFCASRRRFQLGVYYKALDAVTLPMLLRMYYVIPANP